MESQEFKIDEEAEFVPTEQIVVHYRDGSVVFLRTNRAWSEAAIQTRGWILGTLKQRNRDIVDIECRRLDDHNVELTTALRKALELAKCLREWRHD